MTRLLLAMNRFFFLLFRETKPAHEVVRCSKSLWRASWKPTKQKQITIRIFFFCRWPRLGWVGVGLALVITSLHLLNMILPLPDLTQVIDEILQVFFACYEGILLYMCFFLLADVLLSLSLSHTHADKIYF